MCNVKYMSTYYMYCPTTHFYLGTSTYFFGLHRCSADRAGASIADNRRDTVEIDNGGGDEDVVDVRECLAVGSLIIL